MLIFPNPLYRSTVARTNVYADDTAIALYFRGETTVKPIPPESIKFPKNANPIDLLFRR